MGKPKMGKRHSAANRPVWHMPDRKKFGKAYIFRSKTDSLQGINKVVVRGENLYFPELESLRVEGV